MGKRKEYCKRWWSPTHRILKNSSLNANGCIEWLGAVNAYGYGTITIKRRQHITHRLSYETFVGPIPEGMLACHRCDNRRCINPEHIFVGTELDNTHDCIAKGRFRGGRPTRLTAAQVRLIRAMYNRGFTLKRIAEEFGLSRSHAYMVGAGIAIKNVL